MPFFVVILLFLSMGSFSVPESSNKRSDLFAILDSDESILGHLSQDCVSSSANGYLRLIAEGVKSIFSGSSHSF